MKIFFICQRVPFPPDRGDKITTYNEIKHLCREHEVYVFCLADGEKDLENVAGAQGFAREVTAVPVTHWGTRLRALLALFTGAPLTVAMLRQAKLHQAVARRFGEVKPDLVFVYSSNTAQYAEPFAGVPRIMQFADLDSLKWRRYAERASVPMRWIYALEARRLLAYEQKIARSFSHSLLCTDAEVRDFEAVVPGAPVSTVGNGVDLDYFRTKGAAKVAGSIVFTGLMDYLPNVDAVVWFCDEILPLVQARVPSASFVICGNRPTAEVQRLAARPGVTVTGWVADVRPYLDAAEVFVAPLRIARGIQNKVIEALAMGLPVVSSTAAMNGTVIPEGEGIVASDDAAVFAERVVRLLTDEALRADFSVRARRAVERDYTWAAQMVLLDRVISEVTAG